MARVFKKSSSKLVVKGRFSCVAAFLRMYSVRGHFVELSQLVSEEDAESVDLSPPVLKDDEIRKFEKLVMKETWNDVIEKYKSDIKYHSIQIKGRGTALHVAVNVAEKEVVGSLVRAIEKDDDKSGSLKIKNEIGATPLHLAAYRGLTDMCELIIGKEGKRAYLIQEENDAGETPLFWAVCEHKTLVFLYLQQFYPSDQKIAVDNNDTSILHVAIEREMFDLAIIIMHCYKDLLSRKNNHGRVPLDILATRTSAFKSRSSLPWWKEIVYYCVTIIQDDEKTILEWFQKNAKDEENKKKDKGSDTHITMPLPYKSVLELEVQYKIQEFKKHSLGWSTISLLELKEIRTIKMKHTYGDQLLKEFTKKHVDSYMGSEDDSDGDIENDQKLKAEGLNNQDYTEHQQKRGDTTTQETIENKQMEDSKNTDGKDTALLAILKSGFAEIMKGLNSKVPEGKREGKSYEKDSSYLIAACFGITEIMEMLEENMGSVIFDTNFLNENALLVAVKNRQPHVIHNLKKTHKPEIFDHLNLQVDKNENTMLHLAAYSENTWRISGVALQMMWDIKWYQYIKGLVPEHFNNRTNKDKKTPSEIFKEQHKDILEKSVNWVKETAESCSVVAALIAGVSFATSGSVPGGNQQSGEPTLEGQPAFEGFAISSLIGLYFSVTALIMFLSILTSRKEIEDFRINLPIKLLFGLISLFVSIVSMFISFCAGHFFVLTDKYTKGVILFYLYISICIPVAFYAAVQFPLFLDLVNVIRKKVPPSSIKGVLL